MTIPAVIFSLVHAGGNKFSLPQSVTVDFAHEEIKFVKAGKLAHVQRAMMTEYVDGYDGRVIQTIYGLIMQGTEKIFFHVSFLDFQPVAEEVKLGKTRFPHVSFQ